MVMESLFPRVSKNTILETVSANKNTSEERIIKDISATFNIHGELRTRIPPNGKKVYSFSRPGYKAELSRVHVDSVRVSIRQGTFGSVMNDFHRLRGYEGSWHHFIWAFLYDLSCVSLLVFAITGVCLWWKLEKNKSTGIAFLLASTAITAFTMFYLYQVC